MLSPPSIGKELWILSFLLLSLLCKFYPFFIFYFSCIAIKSCFILIYYLFKKKIFFFSLALVFLFAFSMSCESHSVVVVIILYFPSSFICLAYLDSHRSGKINEKESERRGGGWISLNVSVLSLFMVFSPRKQKQTKQTKSYFFFLCVIFFCVEVLLLFIKTKNDFP